MKNQTKENNKGEEEDETAARKGVEYTARVNDKYMDRMTSS